MLSSYISVGTGVLIGAYIGIFVIEYDPPIIGWFFSMGAGVSLGAFVAALVSNTPLAGSASQAQRRGVIPRDLEPLDGDEPWNDWDNDETAAQPPPR